MLQKQTVSSRLIDTLKDMQSEEIFDNFILAGGTALSLQYGHRMSEDIDIFTNKTLNHNEILDYFKYKYKQYDLVTLNKNQITLISNGIKFDIINMFQNNIEALLEEDNIKIYKASDIAAMKLRAILTRTVNRDYIDIAYLLKRYTLDKMFEFYKKKFESDDTYVIKLALLKCNIIPLEDWNKEVVMCKNDIILKNIPDIINKAVKVHNIKSNIGKYIRDVLHIKDMPSVNNAKRKSR